MRLACIAWVSVLAGLSSAWGDGHQLQHHHLQYVGNYYPGPYYSRAYMQEFPLEPGERILFYRLRPFQHYGRYQHGCPIEPNLTNGSVDSYRFPYRYEFAFRATEAPTPVEDTNCQHPLARRYSQLQTGPTSEIRPNEGVVVPSEPMRSR